eukprot:scaffold17.g461.t1
MAAKVNSLRLELQRKPNDFLALFELASALHALDFRHPDGGSRVPEAERLYRRAARLAPQRKQKAAINSNLGALLLSAGRLQAALEVINVTLEEAEALGMQKTEVYVGSLFNSAKVYLQLGRDAEANAALARVVLAAKGVSGPSYLKGWAAMKTFTPEQVAEMEAATKYMRLQKKGVKEERLSTPKFVWWQQQKEEWDFLDGIALTDEAWVYYSLYRAYQALGWDGAVQYDRAHEERITRGIQALFQPAQPDSADPKHVFYRRLDPTPIFVVGMPRSGSTLIEQILASHSQVWGAGEDTQLAPLVPQVIQLLQRGGEINAADIAAVGRRYVAEMRARLPAEHKGVRWIVDKMLRNAWNVGFIQMMLPDACILHAERHPADTGLSCFAQPFEGRGTPWASNLTNIAHQMQLLQSMMDHWDRVLPGKVLHVRYCDLVRDQEGTTRRILEHCGIPWEDSVLRFHETKRQVSTASVSQVRQALYFSSVGRWRHYARGLVPLLLPLWPQIQAYEAETGLESSATLLEELVSEAEEAEARALLEQLGLTEESDRAAAEGQMHLDEEPAGAEDEVAQADPLHEAWRKDEL